MTDCGINAEIQLISLGINSYLTGSSPGVCQQETFKRFLLQVFQRLTLLDTLEISPRALQDTEA